MKAPPKMKMPKPARPPTPNQVVRDVERNIKDGPIKATERVVGRVKRETQKILPK